MGHHHNHSHSHNHSNKNLLMISFILTIVFAITEVVYGFVFNSVALLSEGFHMLSDSAAMLLSVLALTIGMRAATAKRTFGFKRIETIAAFLNGLALLLIPIWVVFEAIQRIIHNESVAGEGMLAIAVFGLVINLIVAFILSRGDKENLNLKAAFLHVFADLTSSVGVIFASLLIINFGWNIADPIVSLIVSVVIFIGGWGVTKESLSILMEGKPKGVDTDEFRKELLAIEGVEKISDLKVWCLTIEEKYMNAHVVISDEKNYKEIQNKIHELSHKYDLHETVQITY